MSAIKVESKIATLRVYMFRLNPLNIVLASAVVRFKSPARSHMNNAHAKQYDNNRPTLG